MSVLFVAALLACTPSPSVTSVQPALARPGESLVLSGANWGEGVEVTASRGGETVPLSIAVSTADRLEVVVPDGMASGAWALRVGSTTGVAAHEPVVEVWQPATEPPCRKRHQLRAETTRLPPKVALTWVLPGGEEERRVFLGDDLAGVSHEAADGCEAVWVHTRDGQRWLLADDTARPLKEVAAAVATALGVALR